jgi:hypothetical protein
VLNNIEFGLKPGHELRVETTICRDVRQSGNAVIIDHGAEDAIYRDHSTPALYRFQSYISKPIIIRGDGTMFGTLCAIDLYPPSEYAGRDRYVQIPFIISEFMSHDLPPSLELESQAPRQAQCFRPSPCLGAIGAKRTPTGPQTGSCDLRATIAPTMR